MLTGGELAWRAQRPKDFFAQRKPVLRLAKDFKTICFGKIKVQAAIIKKSRADGNRRRTDV